MSHPLLWPMTKVFQPIGETAALCLTQDLAPEQPADVLLLGCGDPRYILFTLFSDAVTPNGPRKLDVTCCDNEPGVLARNILLFTLLEDKKHVDRVWDIFYHFKIDDQALSIITAQSQRLYDYANDIYKWAESPYGSFIHVTDIHSLAKLRQCWKNYKDFSTLPSSRLEALLDQQAKLSKSVLEKKEFGANASLMAGMLWSKALPLVKDLFKRYWQTGTVLTRESDVRAANKLNPTFVYSSAGETFNLHPGTFPQGFHLAPAMVSTFPEAKNAPRLGTEDAIINLMKQQSESWGKAFLASRAAGAITLRFFAGDALALCRALNTWRTTLNSTTGVFGSDWHAGQITFFDAVPLQYDVIETSSLTVNLDILNLLIATAPLLKDSPASQSVLYTEERLSVKESEEGMPTLNRLGTTPPTIAALLGLAPRVFISDFSTYSDIHETLAREHVKRFRERIAWVNPSSGDRLARQQKLVMSFDVDDLAQIIYRIYYDMFAKEIARVVVVHGRTMPYEPPFHYTRETVVMLLKYVRRRVHLKNGTWDDFGAKFLQLIENDWTKAAGRTYWLDICLQLHLAGIHSTDSLKLVIPNDPTPPVLCVVLTVPRRRLQVLFDHKETKCTPVLEVHLKIPSNRALAYSSVHAIWGKCRETSNKVLLEVDEKGFEGDSDLVVMFWANTRLFREGSTFALSLKSFPQTSVLFGPKLGDTHGDDLEIFSAAFDDTRYIRMLKYRPHLKDEHTLAPEDLSDVVEPEFKPESDSVFVSANVGTGSNSRVLVSLTARVEIDSPAERGVLLEGVEVKASQLSPCTMKLEIGDYEHTVAYPYPIRGEDYKLRVARKSHYVEVIVPFSKPLDNSGYHLDKAPVLQNSNHSPWNIPHVSSDRMPLLNIKNPKDLDWLKTLIGLQHSVRERHVLNKHDPEELAVTINNWVGIKNTIRQVTTEASVSNKTASRVYSLSESGTTYALLLVGGVRLDLASSTVFLDAAYIPPATDAGPPIGQFSQVTTSQVERLAWQKLLPAFVERCRTWSHKSYCKYTAQGKIPLSTELNRSPICSCGQGVGFKGPEWSVVPSWKAMLPYATRVAICGLFAVTCSDIKVSQQSAPGAGFIQPQKRTDKTCWVCGSSGKPNLSACSRCRKAKYCSAACQQLDWKLHKKDCMKV